MLWFPHRGVERGVTSYVVILVSISMAHIPSLLDVPCHIQLVLYFPIS